MKFGELEKICSLLWGQSWQSELARYLNISRGTVHSWKIQAVPKWFNDELPALLNKRLNDINEAKRIVE